MIKRLTFSILFLLLTFTIGAQTVYPIRSYTVLTPPMPYTLTSFASETGKMQLTINVDDVSLENYPVKFRLVIKGNGIRLYTKPNLVQEPYYLYGGMSETLTGLDLAPLFEPSNMIFEGYSQREYERQGRLPEGVYQVMVEVWDYNHNFNISQAFPAVAVMYLTRAPQLTFPLDNSEQDVLNNLNMRFSWMGFVPNDPLSDVVYEFKLWEILPDGRSKYEVANAMSPIFTEQTSDAFLVYDMGMPPLTVGRSYAWQVRAVDLENRTRFQEDGWSDVFMFRYGTSCNTPTATVVDVGENTVKLSIKGPSGAQLYRIFYAPEEEVKSGGAVEWESMESNMPTATIEGLEENTTYVIKTTCLCGEEESEESDLISFKTTWNVDYTCGANLGNFDLSNTEPLASLSRFGLFKAADFTIEVVEVSGSNGRFSGSGFALVPYLGFIKFGVDFDNVFINSDRRMTEGEVKFQYNEDTGLMLDIGDVLESLNSSDDSQTVDSSEVIDESTDYVIQVNDEISSVTVTDSTVTVVTVGGETQTHTVNQGQTVGVVSPNSDSVYVADTGTGQVYTAPNPNKVNTNSNSVVSPAQSGVYGAKATFSAASNMRYGYDAVGNGTNKPNDYFNTDKSGNKIAWKSLGNGRADYVDVSIDGAHPDSIRYLRSSGMLASSINQGENQQLLLTGMAGGEVETLTAALVNTTQVNDSTQNETLTEAGALGLVNYDYLLKTVHLIPVGEAQCPDLASGVKEYLDKCYSPAVVEWQVIVEPKFSPEDIDYEGFNTDDKTLLSKYTDDMNQVIRQYKRTDGVDINKEHLYLFFVKTSSTNKLGFMPLTGQYGFIFNYNNNAETIAHELGHGTFNLWHTFSENSQYNLNQGTTTNLMDYSGGTDLWKYQWDLIHDPESIVLGWTIDEDEEAFVFGETSVENIVRAVRNVRCAIDNNAETANLYFSNYSYSIEIKDLVTAFNWAGSDVSDEKIKFYVSNDGVIDLDYFEDEFDVKNIQYNESKSQVVIKGEEESLFIEPYNTYSDHKTEIYSFIKTMFDGSVSIKEPTAAEVNEMELDKLRYLSICQLALMSDDKRKETLRSISEQKAILAKEEKLVINLLRTTKNKSTIYTLLQDGKVSIDLYKGMNTYKQEFVFLFNWICEASWSVTDKQEARLLFLGTDDKGNRFQLSENDWMMGDCLDETEVRVWNLEDLGGKYSNKFTSAPTAPIRIAYFDGNTQTVSTFMVDYMRSQENKEEWTQAFFDYLTGVGLSSAGRSLIVKSTPNLIRFLAIVEFGKTNIDIAFQDEGLKTKLKDNGHGWFVDNWQTISTAIDVATFGSEMLINFAKKGDDLSKLLRENGNAKAADEIDDITAEAKVLANTTGANLVDDFLAASPKIDDLLPSQIPDGYQVFSINGSKYIRRTNVSNVNTPRLMVNENGVIKAYTKPQRLSKNGKLRKALEDALDEVPANHQAHHLVPDNIVRNSPLHQEAISRGLYDIDRVSNGKLLAETGEDFAEISEAYPTHFGSHPNYDTEIAEIIDDVLESHNVLPSQVKSLSDNKISQIIDDIEDQALGVLEEWVPSKLN